MQVVRISVVHCPHLTCPLSVSDAARVDAGLSLADSDHVTMILASDWPTTCFLIREENKVSYNLKSITIKDAFYLSVLLSANKNDK